LKPFFLILLFAALSYAQQQSVGVLPTIGSDDIDTEELDMLTKSLRTIAANVLPNSTFIVLTQETIMRRLGGTEEYLKVCRDGEGCIPSLGKKAEVDYVARCNVGLKGYILRMDCELYNSKTGALIGPFNSYNETPANVNDLMAIMERKAPDMFKKIPMISVVTAPSVVTGGNVVAQVVTEPAGAILSVNGMHYQGCQSTPCQIQLYENRFKLSAALEGYEPAEIDAVIAQPNQIVTMKLKPIIYNVIFTSEPSGALFSFGDKSSCRTPCYKNFNRGDVKVNANLDFHESKDTAFFVSADAKFNIKLEQKYGILDIRPRDAHWKLTIGGKPYSLESLWLLPGTYEVNLANECYEDITYSAEIKEGKQTDFDFSNKMTLKQGILALSAKYKGRDAKEFVFVNNNKVGETPFSGTVPLCSDIKIGDEKVDVNWQNWELNKPTEHTHKMSVAGATVLGVALDIAGAMFFGFAYLRHKDAEDYGKRYDASYEPSEYNAFRKKSENATKKANIFLIAGGACVLSSIGVYIWF